MSSTGIRPTCRTCGQPIEARQWITWNGHSYHEEHMPSKEPPPVFDVAQLQPDDGTPGLWIGFKTAAQRAEALKWFRVSE